MTLSASPRTVLAALLFASSLAFAAPAPARADDLDDRLEQIERDLRDLQAEVYRGGGAAGGAPAAPGSGQRLNDIENSLRNLTGQVEQLGYDVRTLKDQIARLEKEMQFRFGQIEGGGTAPLPDTGGGMTDIPPSSSPAPDIYTGDGPTPLGPETQTTGTLGTMPVTPPGSGAEAQYQAGMDLLAHAQYAPARATFEQLIQENGSSEFAPQAQYWIADIDFVQKDYRSAARGYAEVLKSYPQSERAPDAMLKLGLSLIAMGQTKEGCTTLGAVSSKYPDASDTVLGRAQRERTKAGCS